MKAKLKREGIKKENDEESISKNMLEIILEEGKEIRSRIRHTPSYNRSSNVYQLKKESHILNTLGKNIKLQERRICWSSIRQV